MAGKLTIRRVGNFIPHLCLAGVVLLAVILIWLSTAGIPGCALRYIEKQAADAGLPVRIDNIQLEPRSGLAIKVEGISLAIPQQDAAPATLNLRKTTLIFSPGRLLSGDYTPTQLKVKGGLLNLPLGQEKENNLQLTDISLYTGFHAGGKGINATLNTQFHGIGLEWKVGLLDENGIWNLFNAEPGEESTPAPDIEAEISQYLSEYRPVLQNIKKQLNAQQWSPGNAPRITFSTTHGKTWRLKVKAWIPSFDIEGYLFRDADLDGEFENNTITINTLNFKTLNPDAQVILQAAYDMKTRELEFHTSSTAPLVSMLNSYLGEDSGEILQQIKSVDNSTPNIELNGRADFAEDYALNNITLRGKVEQNKMMLGQTRVNHALLSFFIQNGSYNIDTLQLEFPDGHIKATAQAANGTGFAKLDINMPDETLLSLAQDFSKNPELQLPEGVSFNHNLKLLIDCDVQVSLFEPGKSRFEDLLPTLTGLKIQFNTDHIGIEETALTQNSLTLNISGLNYNAERINAGHITLDAMSSLQHGETAAEAIVLSAEIAKLYADATLSKLKLDHTKLRLSAESATTKKGGIRNLYSTAEIGGVELADNNLRSHAVSAAIKAGAINAPEYHANGVHLDIQIPEGLNLTDSWHSMQKAARVEANVQEIAKGSQFCATGTRIVVQNEGTDAAMLNLTSNIGEEKFSLQANVHLEDNDLVRLSDIETHLPMASMLQLLGGEPLTELKLPPLVEARGDALLNVQSGELLQAEYDIRVPELVRVCNNIHVFKGSEIPLNLSVQGNFRTNSNGNMQYAADVSAIHQLGRLDVHVSGDPLKECRITGTNTIPVNIINALIDNADAHWIMRDFRCTAGVTRNNITDINTVIRYDRGIYVHALCKAELINMEFLLGAIRDKEDAQGNPTGEEYLRTDLSANPYSLVKEGRCDVEVLVQLDCVDEQGQPLPERLRINLLNPDMLYNNKPWLKRMGFKDGAATSRITGEAVRFNLENNTISLHKLKGNCYPAYSIGMYYAPIQHFMEDIILRDPVDIETDYCIFPLSRNCDVPMQGLIRAEAPTGAGFHFLGTTIPFKNFSGFINISDVDVYLDRMNAECWGGVMNGAVRIGFAGEHTSLDGYIQARTMNLKDIVASYGEEFTPATCSGFIRFQAPQTDLESVQAYGRVSLRDGDLLQLGLFRPIGSLLSDMPGYLSKLQQSVTFSKAEEAPEPSWADKIIRYVFDSGSNAVDSVQKSIYGVPFANHFLRYGIDEAFAKFDIKNGHLITRDMTARGYNLDVRTQLDIDLDKLTLTGNLWPQISSVPTVLISPITILSKFLIDINLYGDVLNPQWKIGLSKKLKHDADSLSSEPQKEPSDKAEK